MSNAKRRHRRRWRLVRRAIRAEVFRRHWEASGGIDGFMDAMFPEPMMELLLFRRSAIIDKLERDGMMLRRMENEPVYELRPFSDDEPRDAYLAAMRANMDASARHFASMHLRYCVGPSCGFCFPPKGTT